MGEKMLCETLRQQGRKKLLPFFCISTLVNTNYYFLAQGQGCLDVTSRQVMWSSARVLSGRGAQAWKMHLQRLNKSVFWKDTDICGPGDLSSSSLTQQVLSYQY